MDAAMVHPVEDELDAAIARGDTGMVIRIVRRRRGMTQAELGTAVGYSASAISRLERGRLRLGDVAVLRTLAVALKIAPEMLGVSLVHSRPRSHSLASVRQFGEWGGGSVHRRHFLLSAAGLSGQSLVSTDALAAPARQATASLLGNLERVCLTTVSSTGPVTMDGAKDALRWARREFADGNYTGAAHRVSRLLALETALIEQYDGRPDTYAVLAYAYALTTEILTKVGGGATTMIMADRAVRAARTSQSPAAFAVAARQLATVLRHDGRFDSSVRLAIEAADALGAAGITTPHRAAAYANSLCTAAYTVAGSGDREMGLDLIREAAATARHIPAGAAHFDSAGVTLYSIGVHYAAGDAAAAVAATRQIRAEQLPTPERRARYWCDVARAWHQFDRPQEAYEALLAAFREVPDEVRDRSSMRGLVTSLLVHDRKLRGLREFAASIGALP
jgi:transcriptional regulator with XRE-family HTH domain